MAIDQKDIEERKKKIGILTYHRVINDGSILQAYCLQKVLNQYFPDSQIEIIDYYPTKLILRECSSMITKRPPFFKKKAFDKVKSVLTFVDEHLNLSTDSCMTNKTEKASEFINRQNYDVVFVGSDTVWEGRFGKYVPYAPNIYYLPDVTTTKISFAASADPLKPEFVNDQQLLASIASKIRDFDYITVRDETTSRYLAELGVPGDDINFMPDPTLQTGIEELIERPNIKRTKPLAGVSLGGRAREQVTSQLKNEGFDVIDLRNYTLNEKRISEVSKSVNKRLGIFSELDFLASNRFHSSIFTLSLSKAPVLFVETADKWPQKNSKGRDLFKRLGIEQMVWRYNGENIPTNLTENLVSKWNNLQLNVEEQFSSIVNASKEQMDIIENLVNR